MQYDKKIGLVILILVLVAAGLIITKIDPRTGEKTQPPLTEVTPLPEVPPKGDNLVFENSDLGIKLGYPENFSPVECILEDDVICLDETAKSSRLSTKPDIRLYRIRLENTGDYKQVMMGDVIFDASGLSPESFEEFVPIVAGGNSFYKIKTGLFEGILTYKYFLVRNSDILVFEVTSSPAGWTEEGYDPEKDELNRQFLEMTGSMEL
ncbi:MAG: hypothetical protein WC841_05325 [Candidatus Shapirobacteria bacterium]|jgi:hypothetical protein